MMRPKERLLQLQENLNILQEREAKHAGNAPLDLLNQIKDRRTAIALTNQAIAGEISEAEWREALRPLLVAIGERAGEAVVNISDLVNSVVNIGGSHITQATHGGHAEVNTRTVEVNLKL